MPIPKNLSSSSLANLDTKLRVTDRIIRHSGIPAERLADKVPARINSFGLTEELYTAQWLLDWEGAASGETAATYSITFLAASVLPAPLSPVIRNKSARRQPGTTCFPRGRG